MEESERDPGFDVQLIANVLKEGSVCEEIACKNVVLGLMVQVLSIFVSPF